MIGFIRKHAVVIASGVAAASLAFGIVQTVQLNGFALGPVKVEGCRDKAARFEQKAKDAAGRLATSESLRAQEQSQDRTSYSAATVRCDDRVQAARQVGAVIEEITNVPNNVMGQDTPRTGHRPIVTADQLRIIIGQGGAARTVGLPSGTDNGASQ